jgi:hypothetical protein
MSEPENNSKSTNSSNLGSLILGSSGSVSTWHSTDTDSSGTIIRKSIRQFLDSNAQKMKKMAKDLFDFNQIQQIESQDAATLFAYSLLLDYLDDVTNHDILNDEYIELVSLSIGQLLNTIEFGLVTKTPSNIINEAFDVLKTIIASKNITDVVPQKIKDTVSSLISSLIAKYYSLDAELEAEAAKKLIDEETRAKRVAYYTSKYGLGGGGGKSRRSRSRRFRRKTRKSKIRGRR